MPPWFELPWQDLLGACVDQPDIHAIMCASKDLRDCVVPLITTLRVSDEDALTLFPREAKILRIVARIPIGKLTRWLRNTAAAGDRLRAVG